MRHKWNGNNDFNRTRNNGDGRSSMAVVCIKCGCVKEFIEGVPTYFIDEILHDRKAPSCDERLLNVEPNDKRSDATEDDSSTKADNQKAH